MARRYLLPFALLALAIRVAGQMDPAMTDSNNDPNSGACRGIAKCDGFLTPSDCSLDMACRWETTNPTAATGANKNTWTKEDQKRKEEIEKRQREELEKTMQSVEEGFIITGNVFYYGIVAVMVFGPIFLLMYTKGQYDLQKDDQGGVGNLCCYTCRFWCPMFGEVKTFTEKEAREKRKEIEQRGRNVVQPVNMVGAPGQTMMQQPMMVQSNPQMMQQMGQPNVMMMQQPDGTMQQVMMVQQPMMQQQPGMMQQQPMMVQQQPMMVQQQQQQQPQQPQHVIAPLSGEQY